MSAPVDAWRSRGRDHELLGQRVFVVEVPATGPVAAPPLLVLHGFPTSSFDFHRVVDALAADRRVVLFDMLGYGLSAKPDRPYRLVDQADLAQALVADLGIDRLGLLTHDIGDSVGGELLARQLEGAWPVEVTDRVVTNGTLYMDLVQLSAGQQLLEALPDARLDAGTLTRDSVVAGLIATFSPDHRVDDTELAAAWELISAGEGERLLARHARYIDERRRNETRFTPPVVDHPSPLTVVWGIDDPIAVPAMADRLAGARPDARVVRLAGVGHYPMVEAPGRFVAAVLGRD
ncbi:MAG TPA: alpha/beta fold hydrolase [Acidimicrobiales bacterium]